MGEYKRFAFLVIIGACLIVGAFAGHWVHAETEPVIVGVPRDFYPEYAIDAEDRPEGFGVDVMNAVAKRAGLSVTYRVFTTWSETLAALERGDIDVIPLVVITPGRESRLLFTRPVLTSLSALAEQRERLPRSMPSNSRATDAPASQVVRVVVMAVQGCMATSPGSKRDGARLRHRSLGLPGSGGQSAALFAPWPTCRSHIDRLRPARRDVTARGCRESLGTKNVLHYRDLWTAVMAAALVGYLIGVGALQSVALATPVALNTALGLSILFLGALVLRPDTGWMALLSGAGPGAASARMLLPVTLVGPLLLAWLFAVGKQAGLYGPEFQIGLVTLATMALLATSTLWSAARVDHLHHARLVAAEALRESEARYRTAGEAIRYGVWVCNPEGGVEFVSQTFLDLIGKTLDEVKPRGWLDRLPPEDLKPTLEAWHACVRTGSEWTWEHRVKGKDGVYRTILSLGRPVRDDRDRITSWVGFNLDISERKEAEDALRQSEARYRSFEDNRRSVSFCRIRRSPSSIGRVPNFTVGSRKS